MGKNHLFEYIRGSRKRGIPTVRRPILLCVSLLAFSTLSFSQTTLTVRLNGLDGLRFDSTRVLLEDGTGDTAYARIPVSEKGEFTLAIRMEGDFLLRMSSPRFRPLDVPLVVTRTVTDTMEVMLTPLSQPGRESRIAFRVGSSIMARFALLHQDANRRLSLYLDQRSAYVANRGDDSGFTISWREEEARKIVGALSREKEPLLRDELMIQYMELNSLKNEKASTDSVKKWLTLLPPGSPAWVYHSNLAFTAYAYTFEREGFSYQNRIVAEHTSRYFRAEMLYWFSRQYRSMNDLKTFDSTETILATGYSSTGWAEKALVLLRPGLRVGDSVPPFDLKSIDDTLTSFSSTNMLGRLYLIDFWGTWSGMCLYEMPYLHSAYTQFAKHGFTILSISSDASVEKVRKFRSGKWKMPWLNVVIGSPADQPIIKAFGVWGWPTPVLVDGNGKIVALGDDQLTGDRLVRTVAMHIGK